MAPTYKSSQKDLVNYRSVSLGAGEDHGEDHLEYHQAAHDGKNLMFMGIRLTQYEFMKGSVCLTNMISFYLLNNRNSVAGVPLDFSN